MAGGPCSRGTGEEVSGARPPAQAPALRLGGGPGLSLGKDKSRRHASHLQRETVTEHVLKNPTTKMQATRVKGGWRT